MTRDQQIKRAMALETLYRVALLILMGTGVLVLVSALVGCTGAEGEIQYPTASIESGEVSAHLTIDTPQGPVLIELGTGYARTSGDGASSVQVMQWGAVGRLGVQLNSSLHELTITADGHRHDDAWSHCVEGEYSSGPVTVHGAVPGLQCEASGVSVTMGQTAGESTAPDGGSE